MRISPLDIRQQQFTVRVFRGFDTHEVDAFLEDVAQDYESVIKENSLLKEQLAMLEERARGIAEREKTLQETLVTTHRLAEEMKEASKREAQLLERETELRCEKLLEEARAEEAKIRTATQMLKRTRHQLFEELRTTLERYHRWFTDEVMTSGEGTEPKG
ncbi:MAG: DivIVA domain-containing protein [Candidatus Rokubacteria bacterium]|nr:DivIVA domain-containing protein [Candidatus Rokubacteria bacterium]